MSFRFPSENRVIVGVLVGFDPVVVPDQPLQPVNYITFGKGLPTFELTLELTSELTTKPQMLLNNSRFFSRFMA
ncbi:MAG: hypothetical protein LBP87_12815 [Planctomycetaceae bacterium]|jgi:hypothetical protein|nr:hypothetical protein [Planctomycetaceae bacterium]